jgi:hypothetical protein
MNELTEELTGLVEAWADDAALSRERTRPGPDAIADTYQECSDELAAALVRLKADDGEITSERLIAHGWHHSGGGYWGRVGETALDAIRYPDGQWTVSFRTPAGLAVTGPVAGWGQFHALCQCLGVPLRAGAGGRPGEGDRS